MLDTLSLIALYIFLGTLGLTVATSILSHFVAPKTQTPPASKQPGPVEQTMPLWAKVLYGVYFALMGISLATILPDLVLKLFIAEQNGINNQTDGIVQYIVENQQNLTMYIRYFFWIIIALGGGIIGLYFRKIDKNK